MKMQLGHYRVKKNTYTSSVARLEYIPSKYHLLCCLLISYGPTRHTNVITIVTTKSASLLISSLVTRLIANVKALNLMYVIQLFVIEIMK